MEIKCRKGFKGIARVSLKSKSEKGDLPDQKDVTGCKRRERIYGSGDNSNLVNHSDLWKCQDPGKE